METKKITYYDDKQELEAFFAFEKEKKPLILIFHAWKGRDDFVMEKAKFLAENGYIGCALDIYGKGVLGQSIEENAKLMMPFMEDRAYLQKRILAGLDMAKKQSVVDPGKIGAIGFCFGGLCALDLARSSVDVKGVVSFHGLLKSNNLKNNKIRSKILVLHGHDDPMVLPEEVLAFEKEMSAKDVDWQVHVYGKTMHAFSNPSAHDRNMGTVYNPQAEKRALQSMFYFFEEIF